MKYGFIKEEQGELSIELLCEVLGVSRSGYYDWLHRKPSERQEAKVHGHSISYVIYETSSG